MDKINKLNNPQKFEYMVKLLMDNEFDKLSNFILPWIKYQREDAETELYRKHTLFISNGKYFEFLRWLAFKMVKENKFINKNTEYLLTFFENGLDLTGIFVIKPRGELYKLLTKCKYNKIFFHTPDIVTLSNSQLVIFISYFLNNHANNSNNQLGSGKKSKKLKKYNLKCNKPKSIKITDLYIKNNFEKYIGKVKFRPRE